MSTIASINGAAQVLRPPDDGLAYLRHDCADETAGGSRVAGGSKARRSPGFGVRGRRRPDRRDRMRRDPGLRRLSHAPSVRRLARARVRAEDRGRVVRERSRARAAGSARRRRSLAESSDDEVLAQAQGAGARDARARDDDVRVQERLRPVARRRGARGSRSPRRCAIASTQATRSTALLAHAVPEGYDPGSWMDARSPRCCLTCSRAGDVSALDIYVESVAFRNEDLRRMGELAAEHGLDLRAHVEQFNWNRSVPVAVEIGARSVDHLACLPDDEVGRSRRGRRLPRCCCPAPSSSVTSASPRGGRWPTPGRSACSGPTSTPAPPRSPRCRW